ncbi:MAG: hypothetical protein OEO79_08825 [Gemmatimonadota bacterium]|nr:hypothetical protein [Gemmatimonadota bacterium]MDH3423828.1 hypothetical protein [Gemmatimonadota bacterium]
MERLAALPFFLTRGQDALWGMTATTTKETVHGLLRVHRSTLTIQWRLATKTERVGWDVRTDHEVEAVQEIAVPVTRMAGAALKRVWQAWPPGLRLVLRAADLTALEGLVGRDGLRLEHPAELVVRIRRSDRLVAEEFSAELALAISEAQTEPLEVALPESRQRELKRAKLKDDGQSAD